MTFIRYSKGRRWAAFEASVEKCPACAHWRSQEHGSPDALCHGHAKVEAQIKREEKGLPPPKSAYTHCPEHGCELDKDGECAGCEPGFVEDRSIFDGDVGDR